MLTAAAVVSGAVTAAGEIAGDVTVAAGDVVTGTSALLGAGDLPVWPKFFNTLANATAGVAGLDATRAAAWRG